MRISGIGRKVSEIEMESIDSVKLLESKQRVLVSIHRLKATNGRIAKETLVIQQTRFLDKVKY